MVKLTTLLTLDGIVDGNGETPASGDTLVNEDSGDTFVNAGGDTLIFGE